MLSLKVELVAALLVAATLAGVPVWVIHTEGVEAGVAGGEGVRVFTITGVAAHGIWTEDDVVGHNYWRAKPSPIHELTIREGETAVIRWKSADVTHQVSIAQGQNTSEYLEVHVRGEKRPLEPGGRFEIEAGHVTEIRFVAEFSDVYPFECQSRCGDCHDVMKGWIVVLAPGESAGNLDIPPRKDCCSLEKKEER